MDLFWASFDHVAWVATIENPMFFKGSNLCLDTLPIPALPPVFLSNAYRPFPHCNIPAILVSSLSTLATTLFRTCAIFSSCLTDEHFPVPRQVAGKLTSSSQYDSVIRYPICIRLPNPLGIQYCKHSLGVMRVLGVQLCNDFVDFVRYAPSSFDLSRLSGNLKVFNTFFTLFFLIIEFYSCPIKSTAWLNVCT